MKTETSTLLPDAIRTTSPARRALDLLGCLLALPLLCLTALVMSVVTALVSPGPVMFRQRRIGLRGREFMIYKFRTLHLSAELEAHRRLFKEPVVSKTPFAKPAPPLLPGGWFLRASGLDELPQIINVLRGEMSLVGPRPCPPAEFARHRPEHRERTHALPGLTCLCRMSGKDESTFEEMVRLDIHYTRHASLLLDLRIILLTLSALPARIKNHYVRHRETTPPLPARPLLRSLVAAVSRIFKSA
jgi:lipopolysaccharide/colanic/teichoic acid biosynthesis glycosyltransferase